MSRPTIVEIEEVVEETPTIKTLMFTFEKAARPAQFVMVWLPGIDEVPMSLSYLEGSKKGITVADAGDATKALCSLGNGDRIGIRGPFGNFLEASPSTLVVAGGVGMAPLIGLVEKGRAEVKDISVILGAGTKAELLFTERVERCGASLEICTDDGSMGFHGFTTDRLESLLIDERRNFTSICTCGPEIMIQKVARIGQMFSIPVYASVERIMKCGIGLCDACSLDGKLVCRDGPVFSGDLLLGLPSFGKYKRDHCGKKVPL